MRAPQTSSQPKRPPQSPPHASAPQGRASDGAVQAEIEIALLDAALGDDASDFVGSLSAEHLATGGKRMRARLCLEAAAALGVEERAALGWAAAVEMLHNATLVHDDVQDGDTVRRGQPTVWARHGVAQAINVGDLMLMLPISRLIARLPVDESIRWRLAEALTRHAEAIVRGQADDLSLRQRISDDHSLDVLEEVLYCAERKTAALFSLCAEGAALLAGHAPEEGRRLAAPFAAVGVAFQLVDDLIDAFGDKGRGTAGNDVREGKVSILVAEHLALHPAERAWLLGVLALPREETRHAQVAEVLSRFAEGGALDAARARVDALAALVRGEPAVHGQAASLEVARAWLERSLAPLSQVRRPS